MDSITVLLVEDDARLGALTADYLRAHSVNVVHELDGRAALERLRASTFDAVLLDLMLPFVDGLAVCRSIRERSAVPVVLVSARTEESDRVLGLESGADDYVVKPFSPRELLARVRAVVRRDRGEVGPVERDLEIGSFVVSMRARQASFAGRPLSLTTSEFDLLAVFLRHPGRAFSREQLMRLARGSDAEVFDRAVDVQISRLRTKIGGNERESPIRTVRGVGYMLVP
jgi:DNA-binding response OmpR family regulator